jgi:tetratricopeptide (TPR) repeat protein
LAGRQADDAARRTHARWLLEHAPESAYEVPALVVVAKSLEEQIQADTAAPDAQRDQEAWDVYHRLSERLGTEPETLRAAPNARVALSKAAEYAGRRNRPDEAAAYLEKLLAAFPTDKNYLRRAGLARFETSEYAQSLAHWRTLLGGLPDGTDAWYEAKYYQLRCLMQTDPALGQKVFRQLQLLHPDFGSPAWREKFQEFLK